MILHLLKLVWHRKRANALVMAEIFFSFLIVFVVVTLGVSMWSRWHAPLGFEWQNVWAMQVQAPVQASTSSSRTGGGPAPAEMAGVKRTTEEVDRLIRELRTFPQVVDAAADAMSPYGGGTWETSINYKGTPKIVEADRATDDFAKVLKVKLLHGRWFGPQDDGQNYTALVVDTNAARRVFGTPNPVGVQFAQGDTPEQQRVYRVVGVIPPFRKDGEFSSTDAPMVFYRVSLANPRPPEAAQILFRVRPGTPAAFEAELNEKLHPSSEAVTFQLRKMEQRRALRIRERVAPMLILTVIALFLISMVALGLTGVLWQTVTRRMREIGLRRALGASGSAVRWQVLGEVALIATLAVALGVVIVLQLPLLGFMRFISPSEFTAGFVSAIVVIYAITLLCGAYPSWLASTVDPAEALRYE